MVRILCGDDHEGAPGLREITLDTEVSGSIRAVNSQFILARCALNALCLPPVTVSRVLRNGADGISHDSPCREAGAYRQWTREPTKPGLNCASMPRASGLNSGSGNLNLKRVPRILPHLGILGPIPTPDTRIRLPIGRNRWRDG